jgi:hypothetical protein
VFTPRHELDVIYTSQEEPYTCSTSATASVRYFRDYQSSSRQMPTSVCYKRSGAACDDLKDVAAQNIMAQWPVVSPMDPMHEL